MNVDAKEIDERLVVILESTGARQRQPYNEIEHQITGEKTEVFHGWVDGNSKPPAWQVVPRRQC